MFWIWNEFCGVVEAKRGVGLGFIVWGVDRGLGWGVGWARLVVCGTVRRECRACSSRVYPVKGIGKRFTSKQQAFLDFVLAHYVGVGVDELDQEKLTPLLRLKYFNSISDAIADLGRPEEISKVFAGFQKYLYEAVV
jgi:hypothetical protein